MTEGKQTATHARLVLVIVFGLLCVLPLISVGGGLLLVRSGLMVPASFYRQVGPMHIVGRGFYVNPCTTVCLNHTTNPPPGCAALFRSFAAGVEYDIWSPNRYGIWIALGQRPVRGPPALISLPVGAIEKCPLDQ
jgi:hypothetical protein